MKLLAKILSIFLFVSPAYAKSETIIVPVQDLLYEIPNFSSPKIDLNSVLSGNSLNITNPPKKLREKREFEKKLRDLIMEMCPNVEKIVFWQGNAIITFSEET